MASVTSKPAFDALRGLTRKKPKEERCELCGLRLPPEHSHLLEQSNGRIACSCEPCAILFSYRNGASKYARIPRDVRRLDQFQITDVEWRSLMLPIDLAFFLESSKAGRVIAYYPSPAGCTESLLNLEAWADIVRQNPALEQMAPDVEALLVNRTAARREYYIAPLDECYKLTGLIRTHWHGFSGGEVVWQEIDRFFANLRERAHA